MFSVYILECSDQSYYTGHTDDLPKRLAMHGQRAYPDCYTANRLPVKLVYQQAFPTREEALRAERRIKGWRREKKAALIRQDWNGLRRLSKTAKSKPIEG